MPDLTGNQLNPLSPNPVNPAGGSTERKAPHQPVNFDDVHTMPERFLTPEARTSGAGGRRPNLIIIIAVATLVIGAAAAAAAYWLLKPANDNANNVNAVNVTTNISTNSNLTTNLNANLNANVNLNANANLNGNANSSLNANVNANRNLNQNLNANANSNSNLNANTNTTRTQPLASTTDTDSDGLTDVEEQLYGTNAGAPDSDGDSFVDGKQVLTNGQIVGELYLGYNPSGIGRLDTSGLVRLYTNTNWSYALLYPTNWLAQASDTSARTVLFTPANPTGEFIQVLVEDNPSKLTARNYYLSLNPGLTASAVESVVVNGLEGVRSADGENVYLAKNDKIYVVRYSVGALTQVNFMTTFEMMFKSFRLTVADSVNSNLNTNLNANTNQSGS